MNNYHKICKKSEYSLHFFFLIHLNLNNLPFLRSKWFQATVDSDVIAHKRIISSNNALGKMLHQTSIDCWLSIAFVYNNRLLSSEWLWNGVNTLFTFFPIKSHNKIIDRMSGTHQQFFCCAFRSVSGNPSRKCHLYCVSKRF